MAQKHSDRNGPPSDPNEWRQINTTLDRADTLWNFIGPLAQVAQNWKWWAGAFAVFAFLYRAEVAQALALLTGGN